MSDKALQLTKVLLLTVGSKARQENVVQQPLIQEELECDCLVPAPGPHHHQVGGLGAYEGGPPLSVLGNIGRGEGRLVTSQSQSGQEGKESLRVCEVSSVDSSSSLSSLEPSQTACTNRNQS